MPGIRKSLEQLLFFLLLCVIHNDDCGRSLSLSFPLGFRKQSRLPQFRLCGTHPSRAFFQGRQREELEALRAMTRERRAQGGRLGVKSAQAE